MRPARTRGSTQRAHPVGNPPDRRDDRVVRRARAVGPAQGAVRAGAVVMVGVLSQHRPQPPAADDQHRVWVGAAGSKRTRARLAAAGRALGAGYWVTTGRTLAAWGPFGPCVTAYFPGPPPSR